MPCPPDTCAREPRAGDGRTGLHAQGLWLGGEKIGGQGAGFSLGDAGVGQPFAQNSLVTEAAGTPEGRLRRPRVPVSDVALSKAGALFTGEHGEGVMAALDGDGT